jgi:hypothetical protein
MVCLSLPLILPWGTLSAQRVEGIVVDGRTDGPLAGAFVVLRDSVGSERIRVMTDALGRFTLAVPGRGTWTVYAVAVGRQRFESNTFTVEDGEAIELRIRLPRLAVALPALVVSADRQCRIRPGAGEVAGALWEEARKALDAIVWSDREGALQYEYARFRRQRDARSLEVVSQDVERREGWFRGSPFASADLTSLLEEGFVQENPLGGWVYYAPDARVLLSDAFADRHCLSVIEPDDDAPELVGLAFEPIRGRDQSDVEGRLWLDGETAELRSLEYRYTNLPWPITDRRIGGWLGFRRLPDGPWIVERWWIRMPELGVRQPRPMEGAPRDRIVVLSYLDEGGWVDRARRASGRVLWRAPSALLEGQVRAVRGGRPMSGMEVRLTGSRHVAHTATDGSFRFDSVVPGRYFLTLAADSAAGPAPLERPHPVEVEWADTAWVEIDVADPARVREQTCPGLASDQGLIVGLVREVGSGMPVTHAAVAVARERPDPAVGRSDSVVAETVTDESGYYSMCGVPVGEVLTVRLTAEGASEVRRGPSLRADRTARLDWEVPKRR